MAWSLTLPAAGQPGNAWPLRRLRTPEVTHERTIGQEFVMTRNGLNAIDFYPVTTGTPSGEIVVSLVDITEGSRRGVVRHGSMRAADLAVESWSRFDFTPIDDSRNRRYRFDVTANGYSGLALIATKGDHYSAGPLTFNGTSRWADLAFRTSVPTMPIWEALWTGRTSAGAGGRFIIVLITLHWILTGVLLRGLVPRLATQGWSAPPERQSAST
ncbi:MAG: hypothetical protein FJW14_11605 [Acidimicrobiia bacterium]|nr:hypothetical protein [Acidimicrobiia bacterium]